MSDFRSEVDETARESGYAVRRFAPLFIGTIVVLAVVFFGLRAVGLIGGTVVERKVFEQSYQRSEALKSQIAQEEAVIAEIDAQLSNVNLDDDTRFNLEAQRRAANVRLQTARSKQ